MSILELAEALRNFAAICEGLKKRAVPIRTSDERLAALYHLSPAAVGA
jgi:hypothetical protein